MKKTVSFLLISLLFISMFAFSANANSFCDITGDGEVTAEDARLALRAAVGLEILSTEQWTAADTNADNEITAEDARFILRAAVGLEEIPVPDKEILAYEITNIVNNIIDDPYSDSGKSFYAIIELKNTGNVPIYLRDCILDYEDDNEHLLQTYQSMSNVPSIVAPGEKGYFYTQDSVNFSKDITFENGCNLVPSVSIVKATGEVKQFETMDTSIYESYDAVGCRGRIVNDTDEEISHIYVYVLYYDKDGNVFAITGTNLYHLQPNRKTSFDISGIMMDKISLEDVADYKLIAVEDYYQFN